MIYAREREFLSWKGPRATIPWSPAGAGGGICIDLKYRLCVSLEVSDCAPSIVDFCCLKHSRSDLRRPRSKPGGLGVTIAWLRVMNFIVTLAYLNPHQAWVYVDGNCIANWIVPAPRTSLLHAYLCQSKSDCHSRRLMRHNNAKTRGGRLRHCKF